MSVDFFVHPEVPAQGIKPELEFDPASDENYRNYLEALLKTARKSDYPVGVEGIEQLDSEMMVGEFRDRAPTMPWLKSVAGYEFLFTPIVFGGVRPADWQQLTEVLEAEEEEIRVHGTFYGECTAGIAAQISAYREEGEHLYNWTLDILDYSERLDKDGDKLKDYVQRNEFQDNNVQFGITLANPNGSNSATSDRERFEKNLICQFEGEESQVYRLSADPDQE